jgi:uncharacterized protein (DUF2141 family)
MSVNCACEEHFVTSNSAVRLAVLLLSLGAAHAQQTESLYSMGGMVVNSKTGEPVKLALVQITRFDRPQIDRPPGVAPPPMAAPQPFSAVALTDGVGTSRFDGLIAGDYSISTQKPGFSPLLGDHTPGARQVKLVASNSDIQLNLSPLGVITGKVVDPDGVPMRGVAMMEVTVRIQDGIRQSVTGRSVVTDDRGIYRMWNLRPGKYFIKATGLQGGTYLFAGDTTPRYWQEAFVPVYFGGGQSTESASPIEIQAGAEARADFSLTLAKSFRIRGSLMNYIPRRTVKFELLSGEENVAASRVAVNGDTGRFEIQDVTPGTYTLRATQGDNSVEVPLNVGAGNIDGMTLVLDPPVEIRIHTTFTNTAGTIQLRNGREIEGGGACGANLLSSSNRVAGPFQNMARLDPDDKPALTTAPGSYRVQIDCTGAYARSARWGTQDLFANPAITIPPEVVPPIEIVATHGGGTVAAKLTIEESLPAPAPFVLLLPQFLSTGPVVMTGYGTKGELNFSQQGLAPGSYVLYAFSDRNVVAYREPDFLRSLTGGAAVQVEDDTSRTVTLQGFVK